MIHLIWNMHAGSAAAHAAIRERCGDDETLHLVETSSEDEARKAVAEAADAAADAVVAAGGDGTVHLVANAILNSKAEISFGVLPLGTGNDAARSMGLPMDPEAALTQIVERDCREMDVIAVADQYAVNMVTVGNTGKYVNLLTSEMKQRWGAFSYLRGVVEVMSELDVFELEIAIDDEPSERFEALNVFCANGRTSGGGLTVSDSALMNDGLMDVIIVRDGPPLEIAGLTAEYFLSDFREHELIEFRQARSVRIESSVDVPVSIDGDYFERKSLSLMVERQQLPVLLGDEPAAFD